MCGWMRARGLAVVRSTREMEEVPDNPARRRSSNTRAGFEPPCECGKFIDGQLKTSIYLATR